MTSRTRARLFLALAVALATACTEDPPTVVQPKGDDSGGGDDYCPPPCSPDGVPPAPWDTLTWEFDEIDVGNPTLPAGIQNRMIRKPNGDIHVAYYKVLEAEATCNITTTGGASTAPAPTYDLRVATLTNGSSTWTIDSVPLDDLSVDPGHATNTWGIDATLDSANRLVVVTAAGDSSLAQCGSTDTVLCTRYGEGNWDCGIEAADSSECCTERSDPCKLSGDCELGYCEDPNCTNAGPGDVGVWAAVARADNGNLGVAFTDVHNFWDQDGEAHRGLEFVENGTVSGIRPWSSLGKFAALAYDGNLPVVAFTGYTRNGLYILRRISTTFDGNDWVEPDPASHLEDWDGYVISERIRLEKAPDGTMGLLFHAAKGLTTYLAYCTSSDGGITWSRPCNKRLAGPLGTYPGLAYDAESIPYVVYRYCGTVDCPVSQDGVRMAWYDSDQSKWWRFQVHSESGAASGVYNQIVVNPATKEPTIAFQHRGRGSLIIARGKFN